MTTIAYKDGVIAYDSRESAGHVIYTDKCNKMYTNENGAFFVAGASCFALEFIELLAQSGDITHDINCEAFWAKDGKIYDSQIIDGYVSACEIDPKLCWAIGSGASFALAAMDLGKTAEQAVKYAATRDMCTGGKIRTYKI